MTKAFLQISGERVVFLINGAGAIKYMYEGRTKTKRTKNPTSNHKQKLIQEGL